uniref:Uncharacterized protein n=1 Tax=viral metagenome TaxID=1070528 RepID=A0A6C0KAJ8_9ZZZZ
MTHTQQRLREVNYQTASAELWGMIKPMVKLSDKRSDKFRSSMGMARTFISQNRHLGKFTRQRGALREFQSRWEANPERALQQLTQLVSNV